MAGRANLRETLRRLSSQQRGTSADSGVPHIAAGYDPSTVAVRNDSEADFGTFDVVGLDGPVADLTTGEGGVAFLDYPLLSAVAPTPEDHAGRFAVLLEPLPSMDDGGNAGIGRAAIAGLVPVRVYVNAATDTYCDVIEAKTVEGESCRLGTGQHGAQIVWLDEEAEAETIAWAIVRLGIPQRMFGFCELNETLYYNNTASASPRYRTEADDGWVTDTSQTFTLYAGGDLKYGDYYPAGTYCDYEYHADPKHPHYVGRNYHCPT